uniref:hypothetical protein n=1 Tax=uncultured Draconibacterium sp. TaxID=1573823 RepID=UPI0032176072
MDKINISFTKAQYKTLLKLIYLGEWVHESHQDAESKDVVEVEQLIFSKTKEAGTEKMIEYAPDMKKYFPTRDMEEIIHLLVDEYDEYTFWEELAHTLAERDFFNKYGEDLIVQMSTEKRFSLIQKEVEKYQREFELNGIENLVIKKKR